MLVHELGHKRTDGRMDGHGLHNKSKFLRLINYIRYRPEVGSNRNALNVQSVPRSKHTTCRLYKPVS